MAARRVVVHHRLGETRLAGAQRVDQLHVFFDVHVLVVPRHADVERNLQLVDAVERRPILVDVVALEGEAAVPVGRIDGLMLPLDALVGEPLEQVGDRHHRDGGLEQRRIPEDGQQRDHPAVAPADDPDARRIDLRILRLQHVRRRHHVVDFGAAVVDGVVERLAVADAAAILRAR